MKTLNVILLSLLLSTGVFGQTKPPPIFKGGGVVVINERGGILLNGCSVNETTSTVHQLLLLDEFGKVITTSDVEGNVVELNTPELKKGNLTLTLISGDCIITKKLKNK